MTDMLEPTEYLNTIVQMLCVAPPTQLDEGVKEWCRVFPEDANPHRALKFLRDVTDVIVHIGGGSKFVMALITGATGMCRKELPEQAEARRTDLLERFKNRTI